jgi:hypothetical protein
MFKQTLTRLAWLAIGGALVYGWILIGSGRSAPTPVALAAPSTVLIQAATAGPPVIQYQGRLLDSTTGQPKPDGAYAMAFNLYPVNTGGAPLWTETKSVNVSKGLFSTLLGDTTALSLGNFNGQELYLGVTVGADPEATPRQRLAHVAYALYAETARAATNATAAANADALDGLDSTAFAPTSHTHDGAAITGGVVGESFIDPAIARDSEVMAIVQGNGGSGSGINADSVDGYDASVLYKGSTGVQISGTLAPTAVANWSSWGYSRDQLVIWWARPTTEGGQVTLAVETLLEGCCGAGQGLITYLLRVTNTGSVTTDYDLVRYTIYQ